MSNSNSSTTSTFYDLLGVPNTATKDEIKKAYRSLQMKYHPDKNHGNEESIHMTQKINEAYETLNDEASRQQYDFSLQNPRTHLRGGAMPPHMDDLFQMFFNGMSPFGVGGVNGAGIGVGTNYGPKIHIFRGGQGGTSVSFQHSMQKPIPILKSLEITMEQVLNGTSVPLEIERWTIENDQKVFEKETVYVDIPAGIDEGEILLLREKGNVINEQSKGDVQISIQIKNDTPFLRKGLDLFLDKTITLREALCGFQYVFKHLNGKSYTLNNHKGNIVPPHYNKIYTGMGLKRGEHVGNLIIRFEVLFPEKLSEEQVDQLASVLQ